MNITDSPNMVCKVNHAMEDLQHKILDFSKYCLLRYHLKMERVKEKRKNLGKEKETEEQWQSRLARQREYERRKL